jgi:hypothetical protein
MIAWPPLSPDLSPMDFSLWRHLKENMHAVLPRNIEDLEAGIQDAATAVLVNMLRRVRDNTVRRTAACLEMDEAHFERLLRLRGSHGLIIRKPTPFGGELFFEN